MALLWLHFVGQQAEFKLSLDLCLSKLSADPVPVCNRIIRESPRLLTILAQALRFLWVMECKSALTRLKNIINSFAWKLIVDERVFCAFASKLLFPLWWMELESVVKSQKQSWNWKSVALWEPRLLTVASLFVRCLFFKFFFVIKTSWRFLEIFTDKRTRESFFIIEKLLALKMLSLFYFSLCDSKKPHC